MIHIQAKARRRGDILSTESVEGATRPLEGINDIKSSDGLSLGVLSISD